MKNARTLSPLLIAASLLGLAACSPMKAQRGNLLENYQIEQVKAGESTQSDVLRVLGSPTTKAPFDPNIWYYIGQETEKRGILDAKVAKERIFVLQFAEDGTLIRVAEADQGRVDIPLARDKTPTYGNDMNAIQQILGNMGRFNPQETE